MGIEDSKILGEVLKVLAKNTQKNYKATLKQFLTFVNSKEGYETFLFDLFLDLFVTYCFSFRD